MDRKALITELKAGLNKISQIILLIENFDSTNAGVELDLMQKNITQLFETYVKLKLSYENQLLSTTETKVVNPVTETKKEVKKPEPEKEPEKPGFGFNFNLGDDEGKINQNIESKPEKKQLNIEGALNEALNIALTQTGKNTTKTETEKDLTLNERFSNLKQEENLATKHLNTPISDLQKEIALNKKFSFVNELFEGSMEHYNSAITQLNKIGSLEFANKYINELRAKFKWDKESPIAEDFIDLVERRWQK